MENFYIFYVAVIGLAIGSFLNVVIYRLPRKLTFKTGRSVCPKCNNQLKWYHNIPVFSYIFLIGKCGFCKTKISLKYPLVESLNLLAYLFFYFQSGLSLDLVVYCLLSSALITIFFIDLDFQIIPDLITLPGIILGLVFSFIPGGIGIWQALIGMLVGGGSLYFVALLGDWLFKKESMGGGDIKMAAMLGAFLGWQKVIFVFFASATIGLVASLVIMAFSAKLRENRVIPFGPFIALAAMVAIIWGDQIISYYIDNFVMIN